MIQSYTKYKQFKSLVDAKENGKAVRSGLDFLRRGRGILPLGSV